MKITVARTAGFCMGVRRAVEMALDASNSSLDSLYTYGPLIHNPQVMEVLAQKGISTIDKIPENGKGIVLIRAHGIPPKKEKSLSDAGFKVINATCPRVVMVQSIIKKYAEKEYAIIIVGDKNHPEVKGLLGYSQNNGHTISNMIELETLPEFNKAVIVAQTTQDTIFFNNVEKWTKTNFPHYMIFNTICNSTEKRQAETRDIAGKNDAIIVLGGKESGNTRRLFKIANKTGKKAFHIEDISELDLSSLSSAQSIAITAGASTPNWIISKAYREIEKNLRKKGKLSNAFYKTRDFLLHANIMLAVGAGSMTYACSKIQSFENIFIHATIAFLYILSMQVMNNLFAIKPDQYNNPDRAQLYKNNYAIFGITTCIFGAAGLFLSFRTDITCFSLLFIMSILGLSYNLKIIPPIFGIKKIKRIKDIPGAKTILIATAWGIVTSILPAISNSGNLFPAGIAFIFSTGLVFVATALIDILGIQGDRITGRETIPILIGEKKSITIIKQVLIAIPIILISTSFFKIINSLGFFLVIPPLLMLYITIYIDKENIKSRMKFRFIIEFNYIIAGIIAGII
ncbi:MAG: 4-hydroxy-3-methylbut-2-enyl diphosphate reductase [Desulfobacterales bacterium]|nr:4-hydroxy-3-methylbut-2-enyl diphosphate reductase [Desulfobacterales bacterium]